MNHIKILYYLAKGNKTFFDISSKEQGKYVRSLPEPQNDFERSFFQYKCQKFFMAKWKMPVFNAFSLFLYFPLVLFYLVKFVLLRKKADYDAISDLNGLEEVIPDELKQCHSISFVGRTPSGALSLKDLGYVFKLFFYRFPACYFSLKTMVRVAQYRQLLKHYSPNSIIAHHEYSFSSSILTNFCHRNGIRHINVMHGEKLFNIVDAFFRFDECYVWSEHYRQLFVDMRAEPTQFRIALPPSLYIETSKFLNEQVWADYKYYLGIVSEKEFRSIVESMKFALIQGKKVKYRVHPRHADMDFISKYLTIKDIEFPKDVSIQESISNCEYAVGSYSTVLNQAYCSGKQVIIDDVTYLDYYQRLKDLRYWLIDENCNRLSTYQNN